MKCALIFCVIISACYAAINLPLKPRLTTTLTTSAPGRRSVSGDIQSKAAPMRIPLQGNLTYWGEYFTTIGLGTPPQYVQLQVDTGSADLIVYSADCDGCGNPKNIYDPSKSSSVQQIYCDSEDYTCQQVDDCDMDPCTWEDDYGDGSSIQGNVVEDQITIGGTTSPDSVSFGPITSVDAPNGFEATGVDGIWGLAFQSLSGWQGIPSIELFINSMNLYDGFSMCLQTNGGVMSIGTDYSKDSRFLWTPLQGEDWYSVELEDWKMGNTSIGINWWDLNWNGVIVDSGTTLLIVDTQIFTAIRKLVNSSCSTQKLVGVCGVAAGQGLFDGKCFAMTNAQVNMFPSLSLYLKSISTPLTISPFDYLWQGTGVAGVYCLGIQIYDDLPVIIGDVFMQNFHVAFDRVNSQVGFGPLSSCPN